MPQPVLTLDELQRMEHSSVDDDDINASQQEEYESEADESNGSIESGLSSRVPPAITIKKRVQELATYGKGPLCLQVENNLFVMQNTAVSYPSLLLSSLSSLLLLSLCYFPESNPLCLHAWECPIVLNGIFVGRRTYLGADHTA